MKVKELMELLSTSHPDAEVIMSSDGEGNSHSPLAGVWDGAYKAETTWSGEVGFSELTPELEAEGYGAQLYFKKTIEKDDEPKSLHHLRAEGLAPRSPKARPYNPSTTGRRKGCEDYRGTERRAGVPA